MEPTYGKLDLNVVKKIWIRLRDNHRRYRSAIRGKSGQAAKEVEKPKFFEKLQILDVVNEMRP